MKINIEIKEIDNGWLVSDDYFGDEKFFEKYPGASTVAKKTIDRFRKEAAMFEN